MAYDPDKQRFLNILEAQETFVEPDRQAVYKKIVDALSDSGFGVTMIGDRLYVRESNWQASFVLLEIELDRDRDKDWHLISDLLYFIKWCLIPRAC